MGPRQGVPQILPFSRLWNVIGAPLESLRSPWGDLRGPLPSYLDEKCSKKHLPEAVRFPVHFFVDFGGKSERADLELDTVFIYQNLCALFSNLDSKIIDF